MSDLTHWHKTNDDEPNVLALPPTCCGSKFGSVIDRIDSDHQRRLDDAVRDERVRIVTEALRAIEVYADAADSVLTNPLSKELAATVTAKCADAIRKVGCICPQINIATFGDAQPRFVPGRDHRCGLHDGEAT